MIPKPLVQCYGILIKNLSNHLTNKKKLTGQFFFPILISTLYIIMQQQKQTNPIISTIFQVLLKMYISMLGMSSTRQLVTLFLTQRQNKFRQYQHIFGLSSRCHTLSNLLYMGLYMSLFIFPFYLTLNYYQFNLQYIFIFAVFVISSLTMSLMFTSFFNDHKIATEIIGIFFSLSSMLTLIYSNGQVDGNNVVNYNIVDYIAMFIPNSSFSIAIINNDTQVCWYALSLVKVYLIVYSVMEYPGEWKICCKKIGNNIIQCFKRNEQNELNAQHDSVEESNTNNINSNNINIHMLNDHLPHNNLILSPSTQNISSSSSFMICIQNLTKTYKIKQGQFNALNKLNFNIKRKQIFGLLGRNGAGKTTLVDILTNVAKPTYGKFVINYQNIQADNNNYNHNDNNNNNNNNDVNEYVQKIGICYQHQILYEQLTMEQHLYFYCRIKNIPHYKHKQTIEKIIQMLKIHQQFPKKVKQLSGGNKRKLSTAIAMLGNPQLLIFDQPTSGLDPLSRRSVWQILQKLKKDFNSTIILTTHHLDQAEVLSDQICVIEKGKIIVNSTPEEIKQKYGNGYYLSIQFDMNQLEMKDFRLKVIEIKSYLENKLEKVQEIQQQNNIVKFFLKFKKMNKQMFQSSFIQIVQWLQNKQHIKIQIQANNLQQSFIAILKDPQNTGSLSNESLDLNNRSIRPSSNLHKSLQQYQSQSLSQKLLLLLKQTYGIFLRCFYFHKGQSLKFFLMYNINILIFIFAAVFNKYVTNLITQNTGLITKDQQQGVKNSSMKQNQQGYSNNMLIIQGYIIMASAFIAVPIYEKQKNIRRVFNSRGISPFAYWFGTFLFDFSYYLLNLFLISYFITPASFSFISSSRGMIIFIQLGIAILLYTYTITNIFQKITTANTWFSLINMLFGFILLPIMIIGKDTFFKYFDFLKYFYPYYDLNVIIINQGLKDVKNIQKLMGQSQIGDDGGPYIYYTIGFYLIVLILIQIRIIERIKSLFNQEKVERNQKNIQLQAIYKKYGEIQALKNVNYFVTDQRLALLGHNGAGKSTTFGILSGQINQTCGKVFLQNKTKFKYQKIMRSSGICYQQNCLWQNLTPLQIFSIFQWLVPIPTPSKQVQWMLQGLQFQTQNYNKRFQNLSGGNKRKICMAVALFGDPKIRLLDQCSTGLDPSSRVAMVDTIKQSNSGSTIFTTHSMGEAENLCSKAVIMNKGQVLEFDYIYRLKQKYYDCFWIDLVFKKYEQQQLTHDQMDNKVQQIHKQIKQICLIQFKQYSSELPKILPATKLHKIRLQYSKQHWKLHHALQMVYRLRQNFNRSTQLNQQQQQLSQSSQNIIQHINLYQPKLEDVYIRVTKDQNHQENQDNRYSYLNNQNININSNSNSNSYQLNEYKNSLNINNKEQELV